jgi:hypothetical protein
MLRNMLNMANGYPSETMLKPYGAKVIDIIDITV